VRFKFGTRFDLNPEAELALQGSFIQNGIVLRNFRYVSPPERPPELTAVQTFAEGTADVEVRLIQSGEENEPPLLLFKTAASFPVNRPASRT
jgi:hypothetical protein